MPIFIGDAESIDRGLEMIRMLQQRPTARQRPLIVDTPWVQVRWPNPRYL